MVTSRDVARAAGVSQTTVSRVLRGDLRVRDATRQRVLVALEQVGYRPHAPARAMRTGKSNAVGIVMGRITNPFYPELLLALGRAITSRGKRMVLWLSETPTELTAVEAIRERAIDGVIFTTAHQDSPALHEAASLDLPFVLVNRTIKRFECDQVASDNFAGGGAVARYFKKYQRELAAIIGGLAGVSTNTDRVQGFARTANSVGLSTLSHGHRGGDFTEEYGERAFRALMGLPSAPDAIFCANDLLAFGAINGAMSAGVRVPEDVWIVGYDDTPMSSWRVYSLTTVRQQLSDMAEAAVELLVNRIEDRSSRFRTLRFGSELIIRNSTDNQPS